MLIVNQLRSELFGPVTFRIDAGECVALMGPSGAGKSLILRAIVDLDPNEGDVRLGAARRADTPAWQWRRWVAMAPAESGWWAETVGDHFTSGNLEKSLVTQLGIDLEAMAWPVARLSTGERQRLSLVRALSNAPRALLLDEPTAALDSQSSERVELVIQSTIDDGVPVLIVTHDEHQAKRLAVKTIRIDNGNLVDANGNLVDANGNSVDANGNLVDANGVIVGAKERS